MEANGNGAAQASSAPRRSQSVLQTGVYAIRCLVDNKRYVGSTTVSFHKRWWTHLNNLKHNKHNGVHLQRAWNKYGAVRFAFEVLERCPVESCLDREQFWIDHFDACNDEHGYNAAPKAGSTLGYKMPPDVLAKVSDGLKEAWKRVEYARQAKETSNRLWASKEYRRKISRSKMLRKINGLTTLQQIGYQIRDKKLRARKAVADV